MNLDTNNHIPDYSQKSNQRKNNYGRIQSTPCKILWVEATTHTMYGLQQDIEKNGISQVFVTMFMVK